MIEIWDYVTAVNGILMALLPLLHVARMLREKSSKGQSIAAVLLAGILCAGIWLVYGLLNELLVIILTSTATIFVQLIIFVTILNFRRGHDENRRC